MKRLAAYAVFFLVYAAFSLLGSWSLETTSLDDSLAAGIVLSILAAPAALLIARFAGEMRLSGVAMTSGALLVLTWAAIIGILVAVAAPSIGGASLGYVATTAGNIFRTGGWQLLANAAVVVAAPMVWFWLLRHQRPFTGSVAA